MFVSLDKDVVSIYDYLGEGCNGSMFLSPVDDKKIFELYNSLKNILISRHKHYSVKNNQNAKLCICLIISSLEGSTFLKGLFQYHIIT